MTSKQTVEQKDPPPYHEISTAQKQKTISKPSAAKNDWEYQKQILNAQSAEIDKLTGMIGLESTKEKFMAIKSQVDTSIRQNVDLKTDRYTGRCYLGTPAPERRLLPACTPVFWRTWASFPGVPLSRLPVQG